ncbi:MAG TPA: methyltransferase, partial [Ktedonobacterales bacterium]|jgi:O-methyltransferase domain/Dimerisation domain|nr:methyltransferase [Ktedonobacterales bacterium]
MSDITDSGDGTQETMSATAETVPPPPAALLQMMTGYWVSKAIYVAAKLGVADLLADGPRTAEELATATQTDALALYRVLRALASIGVFSEVTPRHFALTPMAELLRSGTPNSMRALAIMYAEDQYRAWGDALYSVQTGRPAFEHTFGTTYFDYFTTHPEASQIFNEAMVGWTTQLTDAVVAAYDFSSFSAVADVGGGHGALLAAILKSSPASRGILFDLPHVVESAEPLLSAAGVADRCERVGGDFFAEIPPGADAYVLAQILHDWDDDRSLVILRQIRQVIPDQGKLLIVELILPEGDEPFLGKWLDLHMLVLLGGQERTVAQYATLLHAAGFELAEMVTTSEPQSIIEARPV